VKEKGKRKKKVELDDPFRFRELQQKLFGSVS